MGYYTDEALTEELNPTDLIEEEVTLYAKWVTAYTLTFNLNGGELVGFEDNPAFTVIAGQVVEDVYNLDDPTRTDYIWTTPFWVTTAEGSTPANEAVISGNLTVYAYWVLDE
jgi:hypothetical protein